MIVLLHVTIALSSMGFTTYLYFAPSHRKLRAAYTLVAVTLISGTYLVISTHSPILQTCISGLVYLGAMGFAIAAASRKLAKQDI